MHRPAIILGIGIVAAALLAVAAGTFWYERPTRLTVAISRLDEPDHALIEAAARILKTSRNAARLQVQLVDGPAAASAAVDSGKADLAVIRTDVALPGDAQTVVILHRDSALLVAPASSGVKTIADLPGRTIGVVRLGVGNESLLATVLSEADLDPASVKLLPVKAEDVASALRAKTIAAVMAVDVVSSPGLRDIVRAVASVDPPPAAAVAVPKPDLKPDPKPGKPTRGNRAKGGKISGDKVAGGKITGDKAAGDKAKDAGDDDDPGAGKPANAPVFIAIGEADAIAQRSPAYEKTEVVRGAFGGTPPRPAEEYDTLSITHRLVANENVSQDLISGLTRFFLTEKPQIAATVPVAMRIEAPSTDKGAALPVHAGSAAYIDDDEQTFFDKYSDMIYIGAMLLGVVASGATAVLGRFNVTRVHSLDAAVHRLVDMLAAVRMAATPADLDALEAEADGLLARALDAGSKNGADDRRLLGFGLALDQMRAAVRDRRWRLGEGRGDPEAAPLIRAAE